MNKPLAGKTALVTGGSRGIGAAIVERLAADGANVMLTYVSNSESAGKVVEQALSHGSDVQMIPADNADGSAVEAAVEQTVEAFGGLDILVNNASILKFEPFENLDVVDFDQTWAVNIRGAMIAIKAALKHLPDNGRIINFGSVNAERVPSQGGALYAMSKSAMVGLVKGLARDLGPKGITVNNIQPGPTDTDMNPADGPASAIMLSTMALERFGRAEEMAAMVSYLAGPEGGFITGASLSIDGGFTA
jgi:3-oxoacyl-[acyl-carrier protein] reductase